MALERFSLTSVFAAHWKGLTKPSQGGLPPEPDKWARGVLVGTSITAGSLTLGLSVHLSSPALLVAALSLMTGSLLTVFAQLTTLRLKLTEWYKNDESGKRDHKDALDESVAHVLTATLLSLVATVVTVAAVIFEDREIPVVNPALASITITLVSYVLLLLVMLIPRLYGAYVSVNDVSDELNGQFRDRSDGPMRKL